MDVRKAIEQRDTLRPDPQTLATRYRLNLLPKRRNFALIKKSKKKGEGKNSTNAKEEENITDDAKEKSKNVKVGGETEAVYIASWKAEKESLFDEFTSEEELEDDENRPESGAQSVQEFQAQQTYQMMCRALCIRPIKNVLDSLLSDTVSVCFQALTHDDLKACVTALVHTDNVEKVVFDDNNLGPLGTARIAEILPLKIEFRELTIRNNAIGSEGARFLCSALLNNNHIRKLDLSGNHFCEDDGAAFGELLEENNALREVNLSHNNFRCRGGKMIAEGLAKNRFLKILDLSWNHLRMDGAIALGECLTENSDLEELRVGWNGFHLRGCLALGHALKHNSSLLTLDLTCNRVYDRCLAQLLSGLKHNSTLQVIKLPLNPLSPQAAYSILQIIDKHSDVAVTHVDLGDQCVYEDFKTFLEEIKTRRDLEVIYGRVMRNGGLQVVAEEGAEVKKKDTDVCEENPLIVLMEFCRLQNLRLVDMFNHIDTDRSRGLTHQEFVEGLQRVNIPLGEDSLKKLMVMLDTNRDGEIDFSELIDGQREYKRLLQDALRDGPMDSNVIGQIGLRMKQHISDKYLMRRTF